MRYRSSTPAWLMAAATAVVLAACGDDLTRPDGALDLAEAEALMESAALPSLGRLAERAAAADPGQRATLLRARETWSAGLSDGRRDGLPQRRASAREVAPALARLLPADEWIPLREGLDGWVAAVELSLRHLSLPAVDDRLRDARAHLSRTDTATRHDARVYHLLMALAELVETTPRYVARTLVEDAAGALARAEARARDDTQSPGGLERARRLSMWAARALEEGDHFRAIQRAYYAIQLVETP